MEKEFYSQFGQDRFLETEIFKGYKNGVFMDIGAHDGVTLNNTLYFEKNNNWSGINIEPIKSVYDTLVINRAKSININCAISNINGEAEFIKNSGYTEMLSGLKSSYEPRHMNRLLSDNVTYGGSTDIIIVKTRTAEDVCDEYNINYINYLSIDVEGGEFDVIKSINFDKVFIDVIGFENNYPDVSVPILEYLESKHYVCIDRSGLDIFMIHKESVFKNN